MSGQESKEKDKDEVASHGKHCFAEMCQPMMTAEMGEHCGRQMREMMSRCMAHVGDEQEKPS